jgi:hypothetical protein
MAFPFEHIIEYLLHGTHIFDFKIEKPARQGRA